MTTSSNNSTIQIRADQFSQLITAFPEFRYLGDPILRSPTIEVSLDEGQKIAKKLGDILIRYRAMVGYGRGLAAPQIGINKSVFVTFVDNQVQTYINPKVTASSSEKNLYRERCLSSGMICVDVKRSVAITMQWTDDKGQPHDQEFTDVMARLIQHEYSHLLGIPNVDQAEPKSLELESNDPLSEKLRPA